MISQRAMAPQTIFAACLLCVSSIAAQEASTPALPAANATAQTPITFKTSVRRVILDVVVTDQHGKPVDGIRKEDFTLTEDGQAQQVLSFDRHGFNEAMDYVPPALPAMPTNTYVNLPKTPEKGPLYVLLYDLLHMDNPDQMASPGDHVTQITARQQLAKFIENKPEGSRFAIFAWSDGLHLVQGFTSDKAVLYAAIDPKKPKMHVPWQFLMAANYESDAVATSGVLYQIGQYLEGIPGRKNLIWFSGSFPLSLFASEDDAASYIRETKATLDMLARNQIAIYPVDARGVVVYASAGAPGQTGGGGAGSTPGRGGGPMGGSTSGPASSGPGAASAPGTAGTAVGATLLPQSYALMDEIARQTGGRAFYSNNDVAQELELATDSGESYYTLSYSPTDKVFDGRLRRIDVQIAHKGYQLSFRRSYFGLNETPATPKKALQSGVAAVEEKPTRAVGDSFSAYMEHGAPMAHALVFSVHVRAVGEPAKGTPAQMAWLATQPAYFKAPRRNAPAKPLAPVMLQRFAIEYRLTPRQLKLNGAAPKFEIAAAAYDAEGRMLDSVVNDVSRDSAAGGAQASFFRVEQTVDVPVDSAKFFRMAVRDANTDRTGSMEIALPLAAEPEAVVQKGSPGR